MAVRVNSGCNYNYFILFFFPSLVSDFTNCTTHVFLLTAATKSDDNYTAVYTGVGASIATALVAVIIVLVTLR